MVAEVVVALAVSAFALIAVIALAVSAVADTQVSLSSIWAIQDTTDRAMFASIKYTSY